MNIGIDAREIQDGIVTGIGRSLANFIKYFGKKETRHTLILFSEKKVPVEFHGRIRRVLISPALTFIWDQWKLPRALNANHVDLFYSPYYKIPLLTHVPCVSQILDLMFLIFPPYKNALGILEKIYYETFGRAFARKSISIITDSEHAKQDIMRVWGIAEKKVVVIPLGVAERYVPVEDRRILKKAKEKWQLPDKYILYLGNFKPHKNIESLVRAFKRIADNLPEYKLVLAGPLDSRGIEIRNLVSKEGLIERVVFTDTVREEDYPEALITMADLFVFPTLYEGFGLPPLEAMACGTPVIASNVTAVPEVVGDAALMVDPLDIDALSRAMMDLLNSPEKRRYYSEKGVQRAKMFGAEKTSGKIYEHLMTLLETFE